MVIGTVIVWLIIGVLFLLATAGAVVAADAVSQAPASAGPPPGPQTLTHDWFGLGPAMRDAGVDLRFEWSQFYQGLTKGSGDKKPNSRSSESSNVMTPGLNRIGRV